VIPLSSFYCSTQNNVLFEKLSITTVLLFYLNYPSSSSQTEGVPFQERNRDLQLQLHQQDSRSQDEQSCKTDLLYYLLIQSVFTFNQLFICNIAKQLSLRSSNTWVINGSEKEKVKTKSVLSCF
jgi:hypothetical protein